MNSKPLHMVTFLLLLVGGLNWGLVGLLNFNLVETIFGMSVLTKVVYLLVGLSAVWVGATHMNDCKVCSKK